MARDAMGASCLSCAAKSYGRASGGGPRTQDDSKNGWMSTGWYIILSACPLQHVNPCGGLRSSGVWLISQGDTLYSQDCLNLKHMLIFIKRNQCPGEHKEQNNHQDNAGLGLGHRLAPYRRASSLDALTLLYHRPSFVSLLRVTTSRCCCNFSAAPSRAHQIQDWGGAALPPLVLDTHRRTGYGRTHQG